MTGRALYCAAGDIHGALDRLYADVLAFEAALGETFDHVLHVGDFGIWPDPARVDRATHAHDGAGDFPLWFAAQSPAPRPTLFIAAPVAKRLPTSPSSTSFLTSSAGGRGPDGGPVMHREKAVAVALDMKDSLVVFEAFARPLLEALAGAATPGTWAPGARWTAT